MLSKGDLVRVVGVKTVAAKIVDVGVDESADDGLVRYHLNVHPDDAGILFGDLLEAMVPPYRVTVPVDSEKVRVVKMGEAR